MKEIRTSVRQMVEFVFRSGDLDNRGKGSAEQAMQEGGRLHRMLQAKEGIAYQAEVAFQYRYDTGRYDIYLEGRADGIISDYVPEEWQQDFEQFPLLSPEYGIMEEPEPMTYVDEIKSTYRNVDHMKEPVQVHLAQAMCYAYMISEQENLKRVGVRMTYINRRSRGMKRFHQSFSRSEITAWFRETMAKYQRFTDYMYDWENLKLPSVRAVPFPYVYREGQKDLASSVYRTIYHRKKLFLQAPTGTGKTLATLYPSIKAVGQGLANMIFYVTAKTVTAAAAADTFKLLRQNGLRFKDVILTAREKICLNEVCDCNPSACPYAKGHFDRINACLYDLITHEESFPREVILKYALKYQVCPHELSLDLTDFADCVIGDYNYVFDPHVALQRFFGASGSRGEYILLTDEAHNLPDRAREMYSAVLVKEDVLAARRLVKDTDQQLSRHLEKLNRALLSLKRRCDGLTVFEEVEETYAAIEDAMEDLDSWLANRDVRPMPQEILDFYFELSHFELIYQILNEKYVIYGENRENGDFILKLFNVDPSVNLRECMEKCRSSVLFSATFLPIQYYKALLGGTKEDYEVYAETCFSTEQRSLLIARDVTSKFIRRNREEYEKIARYIHVAVSGRAGNYMVFCPSYAYMQEIFQIYGEFFEENENAQLIMQKERMSEAEREEFLECFRVNMPGESRWEGQETSAAEAYWPQGKTTQKPAEAFQVQSKSGRKSLIGFCVLGGIFSEGIDLKGESLVGAIIIGTGLPQIGREQELLRRYFDKHGQNGFDFAYRYPGMNKVMQAAGRVIRTKEDKGVILLLDERFLEGQYRAIFPREWEQHEIVDLTMVGEKLSEFWNGF